jgi:hypothetical protein
LLGAVLARGIPFRFEARGSSMSPFIRNGDLVTVAPLLGRPARFGEVVAFAGPVEGLVVHRVIATRLGGYSIRADNSRFSDGLVSAARIFGAVDRVERRGRRVRLGLGPERVLVAGLARLGMLYPLIAALRGARALVARRGALS